MEQKNYIGIYISRSGAVIVHTCYDGQQFQTRDCFSVTLPEYTKDQPAPSLGEHIWQALSQRQIMFSEAYVALDSSMYIQHNVQSQFTTHKQIAQTIRFDAEEAIADDATAVTIAFNVTSINDNGSDVTIFSADRKTMTDLLSDLQAHNIDPVCIEPDLACLHRYIKEHSQATTLYSVLARKYGYFLAIGKDEADWQCRSFIIGANQNRTALIKRELPLTLANFSNMGEIQSMALCDTAMTVSVADITARTGIETMLVHLVEPGSTDSSVLNDTLNEVDYAIASGAATAVKAGRHVDFRPDFMPYLGRRVRLENALKILSVCVTVMLIALGLYFQMRVYTQNKYTSKLHDKFETQYKKVMYGRGFTQEDPVSKLHRELRVVREVKQGQLTGAGQASVSAMLTYIIEALNESKDIQVNIDFVTIGQKSLVLSGDTSSRENTIALLNAIDRHSKLKTSQMATDFRAGRDQFRVTILPEATARLKQ